MDKKIKKYIGFGCGCGCLGIIGIFVTIVIVLLILSGGRIGSYYALMTDPDNITYQGEKISQIAKREGLPYSLKNVGPDIDGVYKNKDLGVGLRFKTEFGKYSLGSGKVDLVLLDDETKNLHFTVKACGESLYDIFDHEGKHWAFCYVLKDQYYILVSDNGYLIEFKFERNPKRKKK